MDCPVCSDPFRDPRVLPCLHTVCMQCLWDIQRAADESSRPFVCPLCHESFHLQDKTLNSLPCYMPETRETSLTAAVAAAADVMSMGNGGASYLSSSSSAAMSAFLSSSSAEHQHNHNNWIEPERHCADCEDPAEASHQCNQCQRQLCEVHAAAHVRSRGTKGHAVEAIATTPHKPPLTCRLHPNENIVAYCEPCCQVLCSLCSTIHSTQQHEIFSVADATRRHVPTLHADMEALRLRLPDLQRALVDIETTMAGLKQREATITNEINTSFGELISQLEDRRDALRKEAHLLINADIKTLELQSEQVAALQSLTWTCCDLADRMVSDAVIGNTRGQCDLLLLRSVVSARLTELRQKQPILLPMVDDTLAFRLSSFQQQPWRTPPDTLGQLHRLKPARHYQSISRPVTILGTAGAGPSNFNKPRGIAVTPTGRLLIVDNSNHRIQIFSSEGVFVRSIGGEGSERGQLRLPLGISVSPTTGLIWVADNGNRRLQCLTEEGAFVRQLAFEKPFGVAVLPVGDVAVTEEITHSVHVYSPEGMLRRSFGGYGSRPGQFDLPCCVVATADSLLVIADCNNHRVQVFSADGRFVRVIGGPAHLKRPNGLAMTLEGYLLVTEFGGDCVSVWSLEGERIHSWGSRGQTAGQFSGPWGVAILPDSRIAVTDQGNARIQLF